MRKVPFDRSNCILVRSAQVPKRAQRQARKRAEKAEKKRVQEEERDVANGCVQTRVCVNAACTAEPQY